MKRVYSYLFTVLLLLPIPLSAMATEKQQPLSSETIKKFFEKTISTIINKQRADHLKAPRKLNKKERRISSYTPSSDQEWEIVVAD
jgi:hypothetical protein